MGARGEVSERIATVSDLVRAPGTRSLVLGSSKDPNPKVTVLLFDEGVAMPARAVKVPYSEVAAGAVAREKDTLVRIARALSDSPLEMTVPRVLGSIRFEGRTALVCSALPGVSMATSYHRWRHTAKRREVEQDFAATAAWLAEFQRATAGQRAAVGRGLDRSESVRERFGADGAAAAITQLVEGFRGCTAQTTAVHGDFWFGNIFTTGRSVSGVVDWESGEPRGNPLRDLVRFPLTYALYLDRHTRPGRRVPGHPGLRATWGAGIAFALSASGWFPSLFRSFVVDGLKRLSLPEHLWRDAALLGLAEMASTSDHEDFARRHLDLFTRLVGERPR